MFHKICVGNVPAYESDTVTLYDISKNDIIGSVKRNKDFYDLINVVIIRLNDEAAPEDNTMKMLQTLFSNQLSTQEKLYALENWEQRKIMRSRRLLCASGFRRKKR